MESLQKRKNFEHALEKYHVLITTKWETQKVKHEKRLLIQLLLRIMSRRLNNNFQFSFAKNILINVKCIFLICILFRICLCFENREKTGIVMKINFFNDLF